MADPDPDSENKVRSGQKDPDPKHFLSFWQQMFKLRFKLKMFYESFNNFDPNQIKIGGIESATLRKLALAS